MLYIVLVWFAIILDQMAKALTVASVPLGGSTPVLEGIFHITHIQNTGAAFSLLQDYKWLLILLPSVFMAVGVIYFFRHRNDKRRVLMMGISLLLAGGIGNLIDRVRLGYVVDMFDFRVFPIFNVADICVCIGCVLFCWHVLFLDKSKR